MVKIRLKRMGMKKKPFYRVVVADERASRDGRFIDELGYYNPVSNPVELKIEQVQVKTVDNPESTIIELSVGPDDMGKVIGKQGRIAKSIRSVVKAATARSEKPVFVEIL